MGLRVLVLAAAAFMAAFSFFAADTRAAGTIGAVVMHGKGGTPDSQCGDLIGALEDAGVLVEAPIMPWGKGRIYDRDYRQSMVEIERLVAALKAKGAEKIVAIGHSMGGNAAFGYALRHQDLAGVITLAAGHQPENPFLQQKMGLGAEVARAKAMIDAGRGEERASFIDFNMKPQPPAETTANIYYSWFAPDGPANMIKMATDYAGRPPMLWIDSQSEQDPKLRIRHRLAQLIQHKPNVTFKLVDADHFDAPTKAIPIVLEWLRALP